jgi:hypothetical protein
MMGAPVIPTVRWECPCGRKSKKTWGPQDMGFGKGYPTRKARMALRQHQRDCSLARDGKVVMVG